MVEIHFGALCDPIIDQLNAQGYTLDEKDAEFIQRLNDALIMVRLHGLVPDSACKTANKRLMKIIVKHAKKVE